MAMVACRPAAWLARDERIAPGPHRAEPSPSAIAPAAADPAEFPTPRVSAGAAPRGALAGPGDAGAGGGRGRATTAGSAATDVATTAGEAESAWADPPVAGEAF